MTTPNTPASVLSCPARLRCHAPTWLGVSLVAFVLGAFAGHENEAQATQAVAVSAVVNEFTAQAITGAQAYQPQDRDARNLQLETTPSPKPGCATGTCIKACTTVCAYWKLDAGRPADELGPGCQERCIYFPATDITSGCRTELRVVRTAIFTAADVPVLP